MERERRMNQEHTQQHGVSGPVNFSTAKTRLSGFWLHIARAVWLVLVIPSLGLTIVNFPMYYQQLQKTCVDPITCNVVETLTKKRLQTLTPFSVSVSEYAAFYTIFWAIIIVIWCK